MCCSFKVHKYIRYFGITYTHWSVNLATHLSKETAASVNHIKPVWWQLWGSLGPFHEEQNLATLYTVYIRTRVLSCLVYKRCSVSAQLATIKWLWVFYLLHYMRGITSIVAAFDRKCSCILPDNLLIADFTQLYLHFILSVAAQRTYYAIPSGAATH